MRSAILFNLGSAPTLTEHQEGVLALEQHQHPPEDVPVDDVVLDVVRVVLHAERQQLQDQRHQLRRLEVLPQHHLACRVWEQRRWGVGEGG